MLLDFELFDTHLLQIEPQTLSLDDPFLCLRCFFLSLLPINVSFNIFQVFIH